jgi:hypothetical protein
MEIANGYTIDRNLLEVRDEYRVCCKECNNWVKISTPTAQIKHSRSCVTEPQITPPAIAKPVKKSEAAKLATVAKQHLAGVNVDSNDVYDAYCSGHLTMNQAMNSDF